MVIAGVGPTLCSSLWATLCWSCVGVLDWGTHWKSSSGRIHAWHGLVRKAGPPGHNVSSNNFARTSVSMRRCFSAVIFLTLTQLCLSICADGHLLTGIGPGNAGGIALPILRFDMLVSRGRSNGCIGNDRPMGRGTTHPPLVTPTSLLYLRLRIRLLCIQGALKGSDSNSTARAKFHTLISMDQFVMLGVNSN